jgi:hypothetical protein
MGIIEAIKKGFSVATKAMVLVLILFIFNAVWALVSIPFTAPAETGAAVTPAAGILSIIFLLISIFVQGGSLGVVKDYIKEGALKLGEFVKYGFKFYLRLLGLGLIIALIILIVGIIAALIIAMTAPLENAVVTVISSILAIVVGALGLYFVILLIMSPYILVSEDKGVIESLKASIAFVRNSLGRVIGLLVLLILISLGIGLIIGIITGLTTFAMPVNVSQIIIGVINSAFNAYLGVVMLAAFMAFYLAGKTAPAAKEEPTGPPSA